MANAKNTTNQAAGTTPTKEKPKFPTEIVDLPSKGYFYDQENTLAQGQIEIKYMTAREEDILTSQNLIKKGKVLDKLMESVIVGNGNGELIDLNDMFVGDKNAVMFACRILGYGKEYKVRIQDPENQVDQKETIDLTTLEHKEIDFSKYTKGVNQFPFTLPASKREVHIKLLTHRDEKVIEQELKGMKKIELRTGVSPELSTRIKHMIAAVDGNDDPAYIRSFVDEELLSRDSIAIREHLISVTPDIDTNVVITNENDGSEVETAVPLTVEFFWPSARV